MINLPEKPVIYTIRVHIYDHPFSNYDRCCFFFLSSLQVYTYSTRDDTNNVYVYNNLETENGLVVLKLWLSSTHCWMIKDKIILYPALKICYISDIHADLLRWNFNTSFHLQYFHLMDNMALTYSTDSTTITKTVTLTCACISGSSITQWAWAEVTSGGVVAFIGTVSIAAAAFVDIWKCKPMKYSVPSRVWRSWGHSSEFVIEPGHSGDDRTP